MTLRILTFTLAAAAVSAASHTARGQHGGDLWVGRTSGGQLAIDTVCNPACGLDPDKIVIELPRDQLGGWSDNTPGFDRITVDQPPPEDLLTLEQGANVWIRIEADPPQANPPLDDLLISPALYVYDPLLFTFFPYEDNGVVYRELHLGNHNLHKHFLWSIYEEDPRFGEAGCAYSITFRLIDTGSTAYTPSDPITLRFKFPRAVADLDCDLDVDEDDFALFAGCATRAGVPYDPQDLPPSCLLLPDLDGLLPADFDGDGDIDMDDFAVFQRCYSGEDVPADINCG